LERAEPGSTRRRLETTPVGITAVHAKLYILYPNPLSVSSATVINYPQVSKIFKSDEVINWVAFGPDGDYVVDTKHLYSNCNLTREYQGSENSVPLRSASFGYGGAWVVVEDDGEIRSRGLSAKIKAALAKKPVKVGRLLIRSWYFVEDLVVCTAECSLLNFLLHRVHRWLY
jgi:hypothetical protein